MDFSNISIIVSEIDGVLTDGTGTIDYMNHILFKNYYVLDFESINILRSNFCFVFLSLKSDVSYNVMRYKNIPTYFTSTKEDKLTLLTKKILPRYEANPNQLLYIGSNLSDIPCINLAEIGLVPKNSCNRVTQRANATIPIESGKGVLSYVGDILQPEIDKRIRKN